jgi:opacity protein-like surface antigen
MTRIAVFVLAVALSSLQAMAGDIYRRDSIKDTPAPTAFDDPTVNWTGVYIGGALGYGTSSHNLSAQDFFKDYCAKSAPEDAFGEERSNTVGVINASGEFTPESPYFRLDCETQVGRAASGNDSEISTVTGDLTVPGDSREIARLNGVNASGLIGDGRVGFDLSYGKVVGGVFAAYSFADMSAEASLRNFGSATLEKGDEWQIGGRLGFLVNPRTMAYVLAAWTQTEYDLSVQGVGPNSAFKSTTDFSGISVGGGVEFAVTQNFFLGVEYQHTFYDEETLFSTYNADTNVGTRVLDELDEDKILVTAKIKVGNILP